MISHTTSGRAKVFFIAFAAFMVCVLAMAYLNLLPLETLRKIPFYDSIGHFVLFGLLGLAAQLALRGRVSELFGRTVPTGATIVAACACVDEALQLLSPNRTFDLGDLFFSLSGVAVFVGGHWVWNRRKAVFSVFALKELVAFALKEARASLFAGSFLVLLLVSNYVSFFGLQRYDFLFLAAVAIQILMIVFKLETVDEAKTIVLFHIIGLVLEIYKTSPMVGSWSYPEAGFFKIANVPLYSGFMYASVGSYLAHAWKVLKLRLIDHPPYWLSLVLCGLIYANFFTNHFIQDFRPFLFALIFFMYLPTDIAFVPRRTEYRMPLVLGFLLISFFVWIAENIGTAVGAWVYPNQLRAWEAVGFQKITSWFLMVIICFIVVAYLKHFKKKRTELGIAR